jgi:predicted nucleic acid-binding protein
MNSTLILPAMTLAVSPDESDNRFLECAESAGVDFLVTGNLRHYPTDWKSTRIVGARELIESIFNV